MGSDSQSSHPHRRWTKRPLLLAAGLAIVIVGLVGVGFIALPLAYVFLMVKVGKAAAKGAVAAAPVAEAPRQQASA